MRELLIAAEDPPGTIDDDGDIDAWRAMNSEKVVEEEDINFSAVKSDYSEAVVETVEKAIRFADELRSTAMQRELEARKMVKCNHMVTLETRITTVLKPNRAGNAGMPSGGQGPPSSSRTTINPRIVAAKIIASDTMNTSMPITPASVRAIGSSKGVTRWLIATGSGRDFGRRRNPARAGFRG